MLIFFKKMKGTTKSPPTVNLYEIFWSWLGAFVGISAVAFINYNLFDDTDMLMIIGSFGASTILIYGAITMLIVALLVNNLSRNRKYPEFWF